MELVLNLFGGGVAIALVVMLVAYAGRGRH